MIAVPSSGGSRVHRTLTRVVFPAPFGPRRPKSSPFLILRSRWSTADTVLFSPWLKMDLPVPGVFVLDL